MKLFERSLGQIWLWFAQVAVGVSHDAYSRGVVLSQPLWGFRFLRATFACPVGEDLGIILILLKEVLDAVAV